MKKILIFGIIFIFIGFILGKMIFGNKIDLLKKIYNMDTYYFLQEGVYSDRSILQNNLSKLNKKVIDYNNDKFYVYVGITKDIKVAKKIKKIYKNMGISVYQKEKDISSSEFSNNVTQFDLLINATDEDDEILTIEEVVLANYDEIVKSGSKNDY